MPNKFRKKSVVVEAIKWDGSYPIDSDIFKFTAGVRPSVFLAKKGDWIVKNETGYFYAYDPDAFAATYEQVKDEEETENA